MANYRMSARLKPNDFVDGLQKVKAGKNIDEVFVNVNEVEEEDNKASPNWTLERKLQDNSEWRAERMLFDQDIVKCLESSNGRKAVAKLESRRELTILELHYLARAYVILADSLDKETGMHKLLNALLGTKDGLYNKAALVMLSAKDSEGRTIYGLSTAMSLGNHYHSRRNYEAAEKWYKVLLDKAHLPIACLKLASVYIERGHTERAVEMCDKGLRLMEGKADEVSARLMILKARSFEELARLDEAKKQYREAMKLGFHTDYIKQQLNCLSNLMS